MRLFAGRIDLARMDESIARRMARRTRGARGPKGFRRMGDTSPDRIARNVSEHGLSGFSIGDI